MTQNQWWRILSTAFTLTLICVLTLGVLGCQPAGDDSGEGETDSGAPETDGAGSAGGDAAAAGAAQERPADAPRPPMPGPPANDNTAGDGN